MVLQISRNNRGAVEKPSHSLVQCFISCKRKINSHHVSATSIRLVKFRFVFPESSFYVDLLRAKYLPFLHFRMFLVCSVYIFYCWLIEYYSFWLEACTPVSVSIPDGVYPKCLFNIWIYEDIGKSSVYIVI